MFTLVPDEDFVEEGVAGQQGFVAFSYEEIDLGIWIEGVQFFDEGRCQDNITYKRRLYDEEFLHGCKGRRFSRLFVANLADITIVAVGDVNVAGRVDRECVETAKGGGVGFAIL